jgi:hypothetical protein
MLSPHFLQRCSCVHSREGSLHCSKKAECRFYVLYTTRAKPRHITYAPSTLYRSKE